MTHTYYHAKSSARVFGGVPEDYLAVHNWFDSTKSSFCDFRHRALRHHAEGIFECERVFGTTITNSDRPLHRRAACHGGLRRTRSDAFRVAVGDQAGAVDGPRDAGRRDDEEGAVMSDPMNIHTRLSKLPHKVALSTVLKSVRCPKVRSDKAPGESLGKFLGNRVFWN